MSELSRDDVVEAARQAQRQVEQPLTRRKFFQLSGITDWQVSRLFPEGRWTEVRHLAGIDRHPSDRRELSDDELIAAFHEVVVKRGTIPTWALLDKDSAVSSTTISRRFGGLRGTLKAYAAWLEINDPNSPLLVELQSQSRHSAPVPPAVQPSGTARPPRWEQSEGAVFGPPIDFRGLRHAPINEQGVVYLFGVVSFELGFIVEAIQAAYPDCEAKRQVGRDRWQRVRIEFEYRSLHFRDHGHDPDGADLIVCWEHNWPDCPIEVLELRTAIDALNS